MFRPIILLFVMPAVATAVTFASTAALAPLFARPSIPSGLVSGAGK